MGRHEPRRGGPQGAVARAVGLFRRAAPLAGVWLVLTGAEAEAALVGAVVVPCAVWLSLRLLPAGPPLRLWRLLAIAPGFAWRAVIGGVDVAWRAFHPAAPINPGWVELPTTLSDGGRVALGAELSLMPGTLVAGSDGGRLLVHVLDRERDFTEALRREEALFLLAAGLAVPRRTNGA